MTDKIRVETSVKDESLIEVRRKQIVRAGVDLFRQKGFHRATTREIAKAAGFSIGTSGNGGYNLFSIIGMPLSIGLVGVLIGYYSIRNIEKNDLV